MIRVLVVALPLIFAWASFADADTNFPTYLHGKAAAPTTLTNQCLPVIDAAGTATTKLCSNYATAFGATGATTTLNARSFGAVCDGGSHPLSGSYGTLAAAQAVYPFITALTQQIDYAALKQMSNTALGADGVENGITNSYLNKAMEIGPGTCNLGTDTWTIRNAVGLSIRGAARGATNLTSNNTVLAFDGLWYSRLSDFTVTALTTGATVALDIDGNVPGHAYATRSVQANTFDNLLVSGGGSTYGLAMCRQGSSSAQCSENTFINLHGSQAAQAVYLQNGTNALDNVFIGGDIQNYPVDGVRLQSGSLRIFSTSFESTFGYRQIVNGGCDIQASVSGNYDAILVYGTRSQSFCHYNGGFAQWPDIRGFGGFPASQDAWTATTAYILNDNIYIPDAGGTNRLLVATTAGTSGSTQPVVPASNGGTVTDGSVVWTRKPYTLISFSYGSFDENTSMVPYSATVVAGTFPTVSSGCGGGTIDGASTKWAGMITEGASVTSCSIALAFVNGANCVVTSPTGVVITSYAYGFSSPNLLLTWNHASASSQKVTWICRATSNGPL